MQTGRGLKPLATTALIGGVTLAMVGCTGITGHQLVQNRVVVSGGAVANVHVDCPSGKKVLSGGFSIETPDDVRVYTSEPSDGQGNLSDHGWNVMVRNAGTQPRQTTAIAVCADAR